MVDKCDICNIETNHLSDYFCLICQACKSTHDDIVLLRRIGKLQSKIESMHQLKESVHDVSDVDDFFDKMRSEYQSEGLL